MFWIARFLTILIVVLSARIAIATEDKSSVALPLPDEVRAAVRDYATDGGRVAYRGTSATRLDDVTYAVVVDFGEARSLMFLLVRRFEDDKGAAYWKAFAVDQSTAAVLSDLFKPR